MTSDGAGAAAATAQLLAGKTALVAGALCGCGPAIVRRFVAHGARVLAGDVDDAAGEALIGQINRQSGDRGPGNQRAGGASAAFTSLDVRSETGWRQAVTRAEATFGAVTVLVNCTVTAAPSGIEETSETEWDQKLEADLTGSWLGMKYCIPAIRRAGGGAVVNTSSIGAIVGSGGAAASHSAAAGVLMLSRTAAIEYARQHIRINAVLCGPADPAQLAALDDEQRQRLIAATPMGRLATPDELADAYVFLASDLASFVTGTALVVDGGYTAM